MLLIENYLQLFLHYCIDWECLLFPLLLNEQTKKSHEVRYLSNKSKIGICLGGIENISVTLLQ